MPRIFDNIEKELLPALRASLALSTSADFCVGYFNLRGWRQIADLVDAYPGGDGARCRLLVGMQKLPADEVREALSLEGEPLGLDKQQADRLRRRVAEEFQQQLTFGAPTTADEQALRKLARQLRAGKLTIKLFLAHPLHAKLYLVRRADPQNPAIGFVGSSNLTFAGLKHQGELNVDVLDEDACAKLARWFDDRWNALWSLDVTAEVAAIIEQSWARETPVPPYHIYLKMAWHLAREAREGVTAFPIPAVFKDQLLEFQSRAVQIAANHLQKRHGVMIGDVVGLGKTRIGAALARIFEDEHGVETLIVCPKNLVPMWERYREQYGLRGRVLPLTLVGKLLPDLRPYHLVLIDESHNLRNREGARYRALLNYLREYQSRVILLSATPYNKQYVDLSNQLRLFLPEDKPLPCRPLRAIERHFGGNERLFETKKQCKANSLQAFEHSEEKEDWRDLLRHYMVRRTRSFILDNYARLEDENGRRYLELSGGARAYFPERQARTLGFDLRDDDPADQYARLYADDIVDTVNALTLPRYGLGNFLKEKVEPRPSAAEQKMIDNLGRAGTRLMGFCRTNLFKRLESSGASFLLSVERHILRNFIFLHAIENGLDLPIGTQDAALLDTRFFDDEESSAALEFDDDGAAAALPPGMREPSEAALRSAAVNAYRSYRELGAKRFKWLSPRLFKPALAAALQADAELLLRILRIAGHWDANRDAKLAALAALATQRHKGEKLLVFTQFADTAHYLEAELKQRGIKALAAVTGDTDNPTALAERFSPVSNEARKRVTKADELRVLIATDVLSEGQNLQDAAIVVNYDLPWAIIRLIQRAGRVDRIGQQADTIQCYSFMPAEGVERIIRLRAKVRERLRQNAEVVGTDEEFFEDDGEFDRLRDLYHEKAGTLNDPADDDIDLGSYAWQVWHNAVRDDDTLRKAIETLPNVVYSAKDAAPSTDSPSGKADGVLVYLRTAEDNDALAWLAPDGRIVSESQLDILRAAACEPDTPARAVAADHHGLVKQAVAGLVDKERSAGGNLGAPHSPRARTYNRLKPLVEASKRTLFPDRELELALDDIYRRPLKEGARDLLRRLYKASIADADLAEQVKLLRAEGRLVQDDEEAARNEPQIICSLGLV